MRSLLLCVWATLAWAAPLTFTVRGTIHNAPVEGELAMDQTAQTWTASFWTNTQALPKDTHIKMLLEVGGTYLRSEDGTITCTTPYTDAVIILRRTASGGYTVTSTNVDMVLTAIEPK